MDSISPALVIDFALKVATAPEPSAGPPRFSLYLTREDDRGQQVVREFFLSPQTLADIVDSGRLELAHFLIQSVPPSTGAPRGSAGAGH